MKKFKPRTPVYIRFWDHARWTSKKAEPIMCEVVGIYYDEDAISYKILSWVCDGIIDDNAEQFAIVKKTITHMQALRFTKKVPK